MTWRKDDEDDDARIGRSESFSGLFGWRAVRKKCTIQREKFLDLRRFFIRLGLFGKDSKIFVSFYHRLRFQENEISSFLQPKTLGFLQKLKFSLGNSRFLDC